MYGNIPVHETLDITRNILVKNKIDERKITQIMNILQTITGQNYFQFNNKYYKQTNGLPMGNPLSGTLAEVFINHLEQNYIFHESNKLRHNITYWYRYVDDILMLFKGTQRQLMNLHNYINKIHGNLEFTIEVENNNQINFLDINIEKANNKHNFKIYRKPTQTDQTIHYSSNHPIQHKMSAYQHMIIRLNSIPMQTKEYIEELKLIKHIAKSNGFNTNMIDNMNRKYIHKEEVRSLTTLQTQVKEDARYITIEYNKNIANIIQKTFKQYKYNIGYRTTNKLTKHINAHKVKRKMETGVYKLICNDCDAFYIGQTGRNFETRFKEHVKGVGKQNSKSNYAEHIHKQKHSYTSYTDNLKVIHKAQKGEKLDRLEELEIYKHRDNKFLLNDRMPQNDIYRYIINNLMEN